ncbi:hypothetical protein [Bradyrhizobium monzae]|uniref:hypothetical protein n=1 Tax=Bradyrhizobium sp. Oc8 TaxID=2876780 RepID=UPI001F23F586|nr:hypothetical protein [Bradyrhizobium sp. Oc8]
MEERPCFVSSRNPWLLLWLLTFGPLRPKIVAYEKLTDLGMQPLNSRSCPAAPWLLSFSNAHAGCSSNVSSERRSGWMDLIVLGTSELSQAMATERQIAANRKNALRSKGPSSRAGVARAARNAYRHGLVATPGAIVLRQVEELAREIAGPSAGYVQRAMACEAAHGAIDLARVR